MGLWRQDLDSDMSGDTILESSSGKVGGFPQAIEKRRKAAASAARRRHRHELTTASGIRASGEFRYATFSLRRNFPSFSFRQRVIPLRTAAASSLCAHGEALTHLARSAGRMLEWR